MSREQAERLAALMAEGRESRPGGVLNASLLYEDGVARLSEERGKGPQNVQPDAPQIPFDETGSYDELFTRLDGDVAGKSTPIDILRGGQPQTLNVLIGEK